MPGRSVCGWASTGPAVPACGWGGAGAVPWSDVEGEGHPAREQGSLAVGGHTGNAGGGEPARCKKAERAAGAEDKTMRPGGGRGSPEVPRGATWASVDLANP